MSPVSVQAGNGCSAGLEEKRVRTRLALMWELAAQRGGKCLSDTYVDSRTKLRTRSYWPFKKNGLLTLEAFDTRLEFLDTLSIRRDCLALRRDARAFHLKLLHLATQRRLADTD